MVAVPQTSVELHWANLPASEPKQASLALRGMWMTPRSLSQLQSYHAPIGFLKTIDLQHDCLQSPANK